MLAGAAKIPDADVVEMDTDDDVEMEPPSMFGAVFQQADDAKRVEMVQRVLAKMDRFLDVPLYNALADVKVMEYINDDVDIQFPNTGQEDTPRSYGMVLFFLTLGEFVNPLDAWLDTHDRIMRAFQREYADYWGARDETRTLVEDLNKGITPERIAMSGNFTTMYPEAIYNKYFDKQNN